MLSGASTTTGRSKEFQLRLDRKRPDPPVLARPEDKPDTKPADGGFQAMDQLANWVRFADTKATILTAGLGVVLTMLMTNAKTVGIVIKDGHCEGHVVVGLATGALAAAAYTLFWLVRAINPYNKVPYTQLNRFAWPSMTATNVEALVAHNTRTDVRTDAWQQVVDLSSIAQRKFGACSRAVEGFAALVVLGVSCVATSVWFTL